MSAIPAARTSRQTLRVLANTFRVTFLLTVSVLPAQAQAASVLESVKNLRTPSSTNRMTVYYSQGYEKRALELRSLLEEATRFFDRKLGIKESLSLAVL